MRQAYDYWQNQPGNYLEPTGLAAGNLGRAQAEQFTERRHKPQPTGPWSDATTRLISYPFAPTEFPTEWSATQVLSARGASYSATCTPQEEDTVHPSRPKADTGLGLPPNVLG